MLRAAGIDVTEDVLAEEARPGLAGFFTRITQNRPAITLKLATTLGRPHRHLHRRQPVDHRHARPQIGPRPARPA